MSIHYICPPPFFTSDKPSPKLGYGVYISYDAEHGGIYSDFHAVKMQGASRTPKLEDIVIAILAWEDNCRMHHYHPTPPIVVYRICTLDAWLEWREAMNTLRKGTTQVNISRRVREELHNRLEEGRRSASNNSFPPPIPSPSPPTPSPSPSPSPSPPPSPRPSTSRRTQLPAPENADRSDAQALGSAYRVQPAPRTPQMVTSASCGPPASTQVKGKGRAGPFSVASSKSDGVLPAPIHSSPPLRSSASSSRSGSVFAPGIRMHATASASTIDFSASVSAPSPGRSRARSASPRKPASSPKKAPSSPKKKVLPTSSSSQAALTDDSNVKPLPLFLDDSEDEGGRSGEGNDEGVHDDPYFIVLADGLDPRSYQDLALAQRYVRSLKDVGVGAYIQFASSAEAAAKIMFG